MTPARRPSTGGVAATSGSGGVDSAGRAGSTGDPGGIEVTCLADSGVLVELSDRSAVLRLAAAVRSLAGLGDPSGIGEAGAPRRLRGAQPARQVAPEWAGVDDIVTALGSITVNVDPAVADVAAIAAAALELARSASTATAPAALPASTTGAGGRVQRLAVRFDGADLATVAERLGCSAGAVAGMLLARELEVAFVGFSPGFAYLMGLPEPLARLPRRDAPRPRVPAGSVAVAGGFAAVYPQASPGGWHLIGTTDAPLFDPQAPPYALLGPGDRVRFTRERSRISMAAASNPAAPAGPGRHRPSVAAGPTPPRTVVVEVAGPCTTVQDGGRRAVAAAGVPRAGAADQFALRLANLLVGNDAQTPALELTVLGPTLLFESAAHVALVGDAPMTLDGLQVPAAVPVPVGAGQRLHVGACRSGARAILAIAGGIADPMLMGSASSDLLSGMGPGPLAAGDRLTLGHPGRPRGHLRLALPATHDLAGWAVRVGLGQTSVPAILRIVPGPDWDQVVAALLVGEPWTAGPDSDRVGLRLQPPAGAGGAPARRHAGAEPSRGVVGAAPSRGVVAGTVQLPPGSGPIVLLCDHGTVGGYPVPAVVASVDIPLAAQLRPGETVSFRVVSPAEARAARRHAERILGDAAGGRYPVAAG